MKITITWEVEDGYCGPSRPHKTIVDTNDHVDSDEEWEALDAGEKEIILQDAVQEDFESNISWHVISERTQK